MQLAKELEVTAGVPVWKRRVLIAHIHIAIECEESACIQGISDLTALFSPGDPSAPDMIFSIKPTASMIQLTLDDEPLWQGEDVGEVVAAFEYEFYNRVVGALYPPFISLHASTIGVGKTCVTCAGISGAGKSSLCTEALLQGASYFSDEFTLLGESGDITPFPRPLQWGSGEHPAFPHSTMLDSGLFQQASYRFPDKENKTVTSVLWHPEHLARTPTPMRIVLLPQYDGVAPASTLTGLRRSQGIMELAAHVHHNLPPAERIRLLHAWVPDQVAFYRLTFSDVHVAWDQVKALIDAL